MLTECQSKTETVKKIEDIRQQMVFVYIVLLNRRP